MIKIDYEKIIEVSKTFIKNNVKDRLLRSLDRFDNPEYYPGTDKEPEEVSRYFIVMVALDHRTSYRGKPYEAIINGRKYHGADLLYRLGILKFNEDPEFFDPKNLAKIRIKDVRDWLCIDNAKIWDLKVRTMLLRDLGLKLTKLYHGRVMKLISESRMRLRSLRGGLIDRLKTFRAYEDPVEKKSFLLVKFLERRGIFKPADRENLHVPVDNHLVRIAFRLGIVKLDREILKKVLNGEDFSLEEDIMIRLTVRKAYKLISMRIGISPLILDDFLWSFGRTCCTKPLPRCLNCDKTVLGFNRCPFLEVCDAYLNKIDKSITEHRFIRTWYY